MRKIILLITIFCLNLGALSAQKKTLEERAKNLTGKMKEVMVLSTEVSDKLYPVNLKSMQDMKSVAEKIKAKYPDKNARKANKDKIKQEFGPEKQAIQKTRMDGIKTAGVTDEQWKKWRDYKKSQKGKVKEKMKGKGKEKGKAQPDDEEMDEEDEIEGEG